MYRAPLAVLVLLTVVLASAPATATVVVPVADADLVAHSAAVVIGRVTAIESHADRGRIGVCCLIASSKEFVRKNPVATKRALRAILKGADVCALEPERVARLVADRGLARYDYALQALSEIRYDVCATTTPRTRSAFTLCGCMKLV